MKYNNYKYGYQVARTLWRSGFNIEPRIATDDYARGWNAALRREMFIQRAGSFLVKLTVAATVAATIYLALLLLFSF